MWRLFPSFTVVGFNEKKKKKKSVYRPLDAIHGKIPLKQPSIYLVSHSTSPSILNSVDKDIFHFQLLYSDRILKQ